MPSWLSMPLKYVRSWLVVLGATVRHSPVKCVASVFSAVLALDELLGFMAELAADTALAGSMVLDSASAFISAPSPPSIGGWLSAQASHLVRAFDDERDVDGSFEQVTASLLALLSALSLALSTTDRVRSVVRPHEFSLSEKLEAHLAQAYDASMGQLERAYQARVAQLSTAAAAAATRVNAAARGFRVRKTRQNPHPKTLNEHVDRLVEAAALQVQAAARGKSTRNKGLLSAAYAS